MTAEEYIARIVQGLRINRQTWFPPNKAKRREMNLRLGREFGYGLGAYEEWEEIMKQTYSLLIVAHSFDSTGVALDAKEWFEAIRAGVETSKNVWG